MEREAELSELSAMLAECARGGGAAATISGGLGCGKTELLQAVKSQALAAGFLVLGAVSSSAEQESPGGVLEQLLLSAEGEACPGCLTAGSVKLASRSYPPPEAGTGFGPGVLSSATTTILHQLCTEVLQAAERVPTLLCVDDVQFADRLSLHWLCHLLRTMRSAHIALVVSECQLSSPSDPELHAELLRLPNYRRVMLGGLSKGGVYALLSQHLGAATAGALAAGCHRVSHGSPLLVRALIEDNNHPPVSRAATAPQLLVADAYTDAILSCLGRGDPVLRRVAQVLAVLDNDEDAAGLLTRMLDEDEWGAVERGVHTLDRAGLLAGKRLRHPVARAAILERLTPQARSAMHRRAAELRYEEGASGARVSRHLVAAGRDLPPWAVPVLRGAAEAHLSGNRPEDAYLCLNAALSGCDDHVARIGLTVLLATAGWLLNPSMSARCLSELVTDLRAGNISGPIALMIAKGLLWHGRFDEAADAIARVGEREQADDPESISNVRATRELLSCSYPALVPSGVRKRSPDHRGPEPEGEVGEDPRVRAAGALSYVLRYGPDLRAAADAEAGMRAMRLGINTQEWIMCAVAALELTDRLEMAGSWCDYWLDEARALRVPLWEAEFASLRASICLRQGDPVRARQLAEGALAQIPVESWGVCPTSPLAWLIQAATDTGDYETAAAYLRVPVPDSIFRSRFGPYYLHARGRYHLETGESYAALQDFTACGDLLKTWRFDQPSVIPWRTEAARAYLVLGDRRQAHRLACEQMAMVTERPSRARGISLRVLAACSHSAQRISLLKESVQILRGCGDRLQLAGALADLGHAHSQAGRRARAQSVIEMAAQLAADSGAEPLLRRLRGEQEMTATFRSGIVVAHRADVPILLSRAERRVAALAACGHTNREISQTLSLTVSTVEQHLTSAFRKLDIKGRGELPKEVMLEAAVG